MFSCFIQPTSNFTHILEALKIIPVVRPLSDVGRGLILSSENPLDFHVIILLL